MTHEHRIGPSLSAVRRRARYLRRYLKAVNALMAALENYAKVRAEGKKFR